MSNFEEAKQYLMKESNGTNIYEHLSETLLKLIVEKPTNSYNSFESHSSVVKNSSFVGANAVDGAGIPGEAAASQAKTAQLLWAGDSAALFKEPGEDEDTPKDISPPQDLPDEANMLEWAGVGFGREEVYRLYLSIKKLASLTQAVGLRLWGKVAGIEKDYYIAEGQLSGGEEPVGDEAFLKEGKKGINKYTYWVCNTVSGKWTQLPDVTSNQVTTAMKLKKFFSGNLNAPVTGYPPFNGTEKELLRAQIARISSATVISPAGIYKVDDEGEDESYNIIPVEDEDINLEGVDLADMSNWAHLHLEVNKYGRCTPMPVKLDENGEEVEPEDPDPDPPGEPEPLRSVAEDTDVDEAWRSRIVNKMAIVKNLRWPGAYTVGCGKRYVNIYVGYGTKYSAVSYTPPAPSLLQPEYTPPEDSDLPEELLKLTFADDTPIKTDPTPPEEEEEGDE